MGSCNEDFVSLLKKKSCFLSSFALLSSVLPRAMRKFFDCAFLTLIVKRDKSGGNNRGRSLSTLSRACCATIKKSPKKKKKRRRKLETTEKG